MNPQTQINDAVHGMVNTMRAVELAGENERLRERLKQIAIVCSDNAGVSHPDLALKFVREIAETRD